MIQPIANGVRVKFYQDGLDGVGVIAHPSELYSSRYAVIIIDREKYNRGWRIRDNEPNSPYADQYGWYVEWSRCKPMISKKGNMY